MPRRRRCAALYNLLSMSLRTPILLVALLIAAVAAIAGPGSSAGLLLLTPVLAVLMPLLAGAYLGERSIARVASWFARALRPDFSGPVSTPLAASWIRSLRDGFTAANGSRGPPLLSA